MLLKLAEELPLGASIEEVWKLLRDTSRLTGLLPGVESVARVDGRRKGSVYRESERENRPVQDHHES